MTLACLQSAGANAAPARGRVVGLLLGAKAYSTVWFADFTMAFLEGPLGYTPPGVARRRLSSASSRWRARALPAAVGRG